MPKMIEARGQLIRLHAGLLQLESHIRTVRESVQTAIAQSSEASHHAALAPNENALVARIAEGGIVATITRI
jgi:hypothetical protein